jgi:hypothetical protein
LITSVNDILSLKKEVQKNSIDSLIPLIVATGKSLDDAFKTAIVDLESSVNRFDNAAESLVANVKRDRSTYAGASFWPFLKWVWPNEIPSSSKRKRIETKRKRLSSF